jgi:colanic acid/amylovoran biosynthesis protein
VQSLFSNINRKLHPSHVLVLIGLALFLGIIVALDFIFKRTGSEKLRQKGLSNIIIMGGSYNGNKGSQAMTFTVVDQIKRRFPDKDIYLLSKHAVKRNNKKRGYSFNILYIDLKTKIRLLILKKMFFGRKIKYNSLEYNLIKIIENADRFIDIKGYQLASVFSPHSSINYIFDIMIAKAFETPFYIFPQSIGPFDYPFKYKIILFPLFKLYLKYPSKIFVRENEGLMYVRLFTKDNVEKSYDLVLQNNGYHLANVFRDSNDIKFKDIQIDQNSVGIIPNLRIIQRINPDEFYMIYKVLINQLIDGKKNVYILRHAIEDLEIIKKIKQLFPDNENIHLIDTDLTCIELEKTLKQFDFVIASRYHSIIHSYKNEVPGLIIGWATKYFELLESFDQQDYFIDIRKGVNIDIISKKLDKLLRNYENERKKIKENMTLIKQKTKINKLFET